MSEYEFDSRKHLVDMFNYACNEITQPDISDEDFAFYKTTIQLIINHLESKRK